MAAGRDLPSLMAEIQLPPRASQAAPGRGPVHSYVRGVWEEYSGWFRHESTTELYPTPARAIWPDLVQLAGGPDALAERAGGHAAAGRPLHALHLCEIALCTHPRHEPTRRVQIDSLQQLVRANGGRCYDELAWLEGELALARAALAT